MEKEAVITFSLLAFEQKEYLFKLPIAEKIERIMFLKKVSGLMFKS
jgi:hypothetical protein